MTSATARAVRQGGYGTISSYVREACAASGRRPGPPKARDLAGWILTDP
jgi:hypothetical protein